MLPARSHAGRIPILLLLQLGLLIAAVLLYASLRRTADRQTREIGKLQAENLRLRMEAQHVAEQLRENERERLLAVSRASAESTAPEPQIETEPNGVIERVIRLKSYYAQHPERGIPEMRLLTDEEWTREANQADLETEVGNRTALYMLRQSAFNKSGRIVAEALKAYMIANSGALPTETTQLIPYLPRPEDAAYITQFQRNDEAHPPLATNPDAPPPVWVFKASPQVDPWFPYSYYVGQNGEQGMISPAASLSYVQDAVAKYRKVSGKSPTDAVQLIPYLKEPVPTSDLEDIFSGMKKPGR